MTSTFIIPEPIRIDTDTLSEQEQKFRQFVNDNLFGQPEAVDMLSAAFNAGRAIIRRPDRPVFVAMALGPSRTGKSEGPRLLAKYLHGNASCLLRYNLNQFGEKHQVSELIGAPAGYVGSDKEAGLSREKLEASRAKSKNPKAPIILVLEEAEKAHKNVFDVIMAILSDGETTIGGKLVDFRDVIIVMTSNLAATEIAALYKNNKLGFNTGVKVVPTQDKVDNLIRNALASKYKPEFLNRIDEVCVYRALDHDEVRKIVRREEKALEQLILDQAGDRQFFFTATDAVIDHLLKMSIAKADEMDKTKNGAGSPIAELHRLIQSELFAPLNIMLDRKLVGLLDQVSADMDEAGDKIAFFNSPASEEVRKNAVQFTRSNNASNMENIIASAQQVGLENLTISERAAIPQGVKPSADPGTYPLHGETSEKQPKFWHAELVATATNGVRLLQTRSFFENLVLSCDGLKYLDGTIDFERGMIRIKFAGSRQAIALIRQQHPAACINTFPRCL